jgi:hypothetical protein
MKVVVLGASRTPAFGEAGTPFRSREVMSGDPRDEGRRLSGRREA